MQMVVRKYSVAYAAVTYNVPQKGHAAALLVGLTHRQVYGDPIGPRIVVQQATTAEHEDSQV